MRVCRKQRLSTRLLRSGVTLILLLLAIDGSFAQQDRVDGNAPQNSAPAAQLRLPGQGAAEPQDQPTANRPPVRNELRHPSEPTRELRMTAASDPRALSDPRAPSGERPSGPPMPGDHERASLNAAPAFPPQTTPAAEVASRADSERPSPNTAVSLGNSNRTASVAPPLPMDASTTSASPQVRSPELSQEADEEIPSVHVIGQGPQESGTPSLLNSLDNDGESRPQSTKLRLAPPKEKRTSDAPSIAASWAKPQVMTTVLSLAVVLTSFFALTWFLRRAKPSASAKLPEEAVEILGRLPLEGRQQIQLVRFGRKLLLWVVTPNSVQTLSEITDPDDVDQLMEFCEASKRGSLSDSFRQVLNELGNEPTNRGFLADRSLEEIIDPPANRRRSSGRRNAYEA